MTQFGAFDILIAGGGYAGLALACALSRSGGGELSVAVVEPGALSTDVSGRPDARASALAATSCRLLTKLGIWPAIAAAAEPVRKIEITDSSLEAGVRPVLLSYDTTLDDGAAGTVIIENQALRQALIRTLRSAPGVTLLPCRRVQEMSAGMANAAVTLDNRTVVRAQLVIAADGRMSPLRQAAGIKTIGWSYAQTGIVTTVALERPHQGVAVQHFLPGGPFALLPLPGNRACVTWSEDAAEAARILGLDDQGFHQEIEQRIGGRYGSIQVVGPRQSWPLDLQLARSLVAPRLALISDAARSVHPIAGQGLNLGLRDVAALTDVILEAARVGSDIGATDVLVRYERWRRADGAMSAAAFDGLNRLFSNDWTVLRTVRDAGLGVVDRLPALKSLFVAEASGTTGALPTLMQPGV